MKFLKKCSIVVANVVKWGFKNLGKLLIILLVLAFIFGVTAKRTGEAGQKNQQQNSQTNSALAEEVAKLRSELEKIRKSEVVVAKPTATASPTVIVVKPQPTNPIRQVIYPTNGTAREVGAVRSEVRQHGRTYEVRDPNWRCRLDFSTGIWTDLNWNTEFVSPPEVIIDRMHNGRKVGLFRPFEQFRITHPVQAEEILRNRRPVPDREIHFNY